MAKKNIFPVVAIVLCIVLLGSSLRGRKDSSESTCEHIYGEIVTLKQAKCEEEGATKQECLICGEIKVEKIPSKGGHVFVEKSVLIEPTCAQAGAVNKECAVCKEKMIDRLPMTDDHVYDAGVETEENILYTCTRCGKTKTVERHKHEDLDFSGNCDICNEPFDALANATEVDVVDGEYVAGNWYRFYRPTVIGIEYWYSLNVELVNSGYETTLCLIIKNIGDWTSYNYIQYIGSDPGASFRDIKCFLKDDYIDLYFAEGVYNLDKDDVTAEIAEDSTISLGNYGEYIKRLVLN